jgi:hypothetical protein
VYIMAYKASLKCILKMLFCQKTSIVEQSSFVTPDVLRMFHWLYLVAYLLAGILDGNCSPPSAFDFLLLLCFGVRLVASSVI